MFVKYIKLIWYNRRFNNDIFFLYKLLNNLIEYPEFLEKIPLNVPLHTLRSTNAFYSQPKKSNYSHYAPTNRILLNPNFFDPPSKLKNILSDHLYV